MFLKFYSLILYIKKYFSCLPKEIQEELIDTLENYRDLCRIGRIINFKENK